MGVWVTMLLVAGGYNGKMCAAAAPAPPPALLWSRHVLVTLARVLRCLLRCCCYTQGFFEPTSYNDAIRKGFKESICI